MILSRDGWVYRIAQFSLTEPEKYKWEHDGISLCVLFWTITVRVPLFIAVMLLFLPLILLAMGVEVLERHWSHRSRPSYKPEIFRVFVSRLHAAKMRVCPLVRFV